MDAIQASFDCPDLESPMGERRKDALRVNLEKILKKQSEGLDFESVFEVNEMTDLECLVA